MNDIGNIALTIVLAIISLATLSVILSKNAATVGVLGAVASLISKSIGAATAPVSGGIGSSALNVGNLQLG